MANLDNWDDEEEGGEQVGGEKVIVDVDIDIDTAEPETESDPSQYPVADQRRKIDLVIMEQMLRDGRTTREIAEFFQCSPHTVTLSHNNLKKRWEEEPEKLVAKSKIAHRDNLDAISQLGSINKSIMEELDRARRLIIREDRKVIEREVIEDQLEKDPGNPELLERLKTKAHINFNSILKIQASVIDISAEVRKQLELQLKIAETLYNATMMAQFQEEVLNAIGKASITTRDAIIKELKQRRTLRGLMQPKK